MNAIQVYEGEGAPRGVAVRRMLKKPLPKKPVYVITRKDEGDGFEHLFIDVKSTGEFGTMSTSYFTLSWQGGDGNHGLQTLNNWYGGSVELKGTTRHDVEGRMRWLSRLLKRVSTINRDPKDIIEALEALGIVQGELDEITDTYRPIDKLVPVGFAKWWEDGTSSSMSAFSVVAESEGEARGLIEDCLSAHGYLDNRLDAWRAAGRPVKKGREARPPRWTKADVPYKKVAAEAT